jgi:hypothetical protein
MGLLDFHGAYKIIFVVALKHTNVWPSAEFKTIPNNLACAKPGPCMFALSLSLLYYNFYSGDTKGGSIPVLLTSHLNCLD